MVNFIISCVCAVYGYCDISILNGTRNQWTNILTHHPRMNMISMNCDIDTASNHPRFADIFRSALRPSTTSALVRSPDGVDVN